MKRIVKTMILGATLLGSAHAAEQGVASPAAAPQLNKAQGKVASIQQEPSAGKQTKPSRKKANKPVGAGKTERSAKGQQDGMTETTSESLEQTVQLRGVRG